MADSLRNPVVTTQRMMLRAAIAGYDAQYGERAIDEQHDVPAGCANRVEAVVESARNLEATLNDLYGELPLLERSA